MVLNMSVVLHLLPAYTRHSVHSLYLSQRQKELETNRKRVCKEYFGDDSVVITMIKQMSTTILFI